MTRFVMSTPASERFQRVDAAGRPAGESVVVAATSITAQRDVTGDGDVMRLRWESVMPLCSVGVTGLLDVVRDGSAGAVMPGCDQRGDDTGTEEI